MEIKNILNLHNLIQCFNYEYQSIYAENKGSINIMIDMRHGKLLINIPKKVKEDITTFENILDDIKKYFDIDIRGNRIELIARFEWFKRLEN